MRLVGQKGKGKQYDLPQVNEVVDLIVGDMTATQVTKMLFQNCNHTTRNKLEMIILCS